MLIGRNSITCVIILITELPQRYNKDQHPYQSYIRAFSLLNLIFSFKNLQHNLQYPLISFVKEEQKKIKYSKTNFKKLNKRDINQRTALSVIKVLLKKQEN